LPLPALKGGQTESEDQAKQQCPSEQHESEPLTTG